MGTEKEGFVVWLSKIQKEDFKLAGEKGANLGELLGRNFPVPEGFVVTTKSYSEFLKSNGIDAKLKSLFEKINPENDEEVASACKTAEELIGKAEFFEELKEEIVEAYETLGANKHEIEKGSALDILNSAFEPIFVSVRSSFPSAKLPQFSVREQNTYLNVKGRDAILLHIKKCFASLFNSRTIKRELVQGKTLSEIEIAVIVQKMIMAEKSGFAFSKNSNNNLEISAIWGLGEGFNLKEISPDEYELSETLDFVNKKIGQKNFRVTRDSAGALKKVPSSEERKVAQVLNNYEIQRIGDLAEKIESHFQKPQKIDFSIDESGIYILQTRTLGEKTFEKISVSAPENKKPVEIEKVDKITKTKIKLFLDLPSLSEESAKSALRKVGLLEIEKEVEKTGKHPLHFLKNNSLEEYEKVIYDGLKKSAEHFDEIWIRCGNFVSENSLRLEGAISETNPLLGLHGIRFGLKYPDILKSELNAVKKISGKAKTGILIPNIVSVVELKKVREILKNLEMENVSVGIVIETPASVQLIKDFCSENLDLVLINTDGILQHLLAADKNNSAVSEILNFAHPSFMYQVEYLIRIAKRNGIETILFGSAIKNDEILRQVIQKGVDFVCVPATDAKATSEKIYEIEEELLGGTDLEPRKYEIAKEKKEYLNEENSFETSEQILDVDEGVKAIEAEKQEYLASSNEENL